MGRVRLKGKGLFKPPRHKWIANIVTFTSVTGARKAAKKLLNLLKSKKTGRKTDLAILRALYYAANRAKAFLKRKNLKPKTRRRLKKIHKIYSSYAKRASKIYAKTYKR